MPRRMFEGCRHAQQHEQRRTMQKQKQRWKLLGVAARGLDGGIDRLHYSSRSRSIFSTRAHRPPNRYPPLLLLFKAAVFTAFNAAVAVDVFSANFVANCACRRFRHRVCRRFRLCRRCQPAIASLPLPLSPQPPPPPTFCLPVLLETCFVPSADTDFAFICFF